jgi:hypothetical protein
MSGFQSATPAGYQMVSTGYPGMGGFGFGSGFGLDALLILLLLGPNGFGRGGYGSPAANAVTTDVVLQPAFQSLQQQIAQLAENQATAAITNKIGDQMQAQASQAGSIGAAIGGLQASIENSRFTALDQNNNLYRDITAQNTQALLNANQQTQITNGLITNGFNQNYLATLTGFNGVEKSIDGLSREQAECCCQIKESILTNAQRGIDLQNQIQKENLISQLNDAKAQISNLSQTNQLIQAMQAQTTTILHHMFPWYGSSNGNNGNNGNNSVR